MDAIRVHARGLPAVRPTILKVLQAVATIALLVLLMTAFTVSSITIPSASMAPALERGDAVLVARLFYHLRPPRRGDIILFRYPQDTSRLFVKRVVGLPGEVVEERRGQFYVNGTPLAQGEPARSDDGPGPATTLGPIRIPAGRLFVLGDNRDASLDSRFWGTVDERNVIGKAFLIYWSSGKHWWDVRWRRIGRWLR